MFNVKNKFFALLLTGLLFCNPVCIGAENIETNDMVIYPISDIFTSNNIRNKFFTDLVKSQKKEFVDIFTTEFKEKFPNSVDKMSESTKYKTFIAYIHVPRAAMNERKKSDSVYELILPITASINIINLATSETMYSYPYTFYSRYTTTAEKANSTQGEKNINSLYLQAYKDVVKLLTEKAAQDFKPFQIETKIIEHYKNLVVMDKGLSTGIAKGDELIDADGNIVRVIYSELDYSIAQLMGKPSRNSVFTKFANASISQLKKPKVLFVNDFKDEKVYDLFSSSVGQNADFSLSTVNRTIDKVQYSIRSLNEDLKISSEYIYKRDIPDYFLQLNLTKPIHATYPSNNQHASLERYCSLCSAIIFDRSGRVVFAKYADDSIQDEVISDLKFTDTSRFEVLAKNILGSLGSTMAKEIKFKKVQLPIKKVKDGDIFVKDSQGFLREGTSVTVYRKVKVNKKKTVIIPTWNYNVSLATSSMTRLTPDSSIVDDIGFPKKKDLIIIETIPSRTNKTTVLYNYDIEKQAIPGNEVELKQFKTLGFNALASTMKSPVVINKDELASIVNNLNDNYGFKNKLIIPENKSGLTIKPVYKIKLLSEKRSNTLLKQTYEVVVGVVAKKDGEITHKTGVRQEITIAVPSTDNTDIIEYELLKYIYPLIQKIATEF